MNKRTIVILSIATSLLSLLFVLASYYGYIRSAELRKKQASVYSKKYKDLPKAIPEKVVISITPKVNDLNKIKPMINSILDQTVRVDQILLSCQYSVSKNIPKYLENIVSICPVKADYGKGNKFIPVLLKEKNGTTPIIILDDDVIYGKDYIETLVLDAAENKNCVITDQNHYGILLRPDCYDMVNFDQIASDKNNNSQCIVYDKTWFLENAPEIKIIQYNENHKYAL